jgi:hypothetical protein
MADSSGAISVMRDYVTPTMQTLTALASVASVLFLVYGGFLYMTSRGHPEKLEHAKRVLRNALIGLVMVLGAATLTALLSGAMPHDTPPSSAALPSLQAIEPKPASNGLIDVLINAITGLLNNIIQVVASPFLSALDFFTKSTPLMTQNSSVFNLWLAMVGITDVLFVVIVALLGFHVMSAATFGLDEVELKQLLPRIGLIFLFLNTSLFLIDGIIELSNVLITAISHVGGAKSVWEVLTSVFKEAGAQSVAALLIMLVFLIFSVILLVYYVGRLVTLFVGAVLSPLIILIWLVPGFRDFSETAMKTYISAIFVLFVHVVILQLAASLFAGMSATTHNDVPNTLIAMVTGLATVIALLKTQGVMMQFSYVSLGPRSARQLGTQFMNGVSYIGGKHKTVATSAAGKVGGRSRAANIVPLARRGNLSVYSRPHGGSGGVTPTVGVTRVRATTSQTPKAPLVSSERPLVAVRTLPTRRSRSSIKEDN